jgi:hypothetical protein
MQTDGPEVVAKGNTTVSDQRERGAGHAAVARLQSMRFQSAGPSLLQGVRVETSDSECIDQQQAVSPKEMAVFLCASHGEAHEGALVERGDILISRLESQ